MKALDNELATIAATKQVRDYLNHYGQVLLTNYRAFHLLWRDPAGNQHDGERFVLAHGVSDFWQLAAQPRKAAEQYGERLADYLQRIMLHAAPLDNPRDLAFFLASYAREARYRVEHAPLDALASLRTSLETALGLKVETERGLHFFRSTLVQTLFYGVFSAWVLWHRERAGPHRCVQLENGRLQPAPARLAQTLPRTHRPGACACPGCERAARLGVCCPRPGAAALPSFVSSPRNTLSNTSTSPSSKLLTRSSARTSVFGTHPEELVRYMVARVESNIRAEQFGRPAGLRRS